MKISDLADSLDEQNNDKNKQQDKQAQLDTVIQSGDKVANAVSQGSDKIAAGLKTVGGEVKISNPDLAKTEDVTSAIDAINKLNITTFMSNPTYHDMASNMKVLSDEVQTLQQKFEKEGLTEISSSFSDLVSKLDQISKTLTGSQVTVDAKLQKTIDSLSKSIDKIDFNPTVNVSSPETKVVTTPVDLGPVITALGKVEKAVSSQETPDNEVDLSSVVSGLESVRSSITALRFPVANYVLPFKDANGKATQAQLGSDGTLPISGTFSSTPPVDVSPPTQSITTRDIASTTATTNANSQSFRTGVPTANSTALFTLSSYETVSIEVTGVWSGNLLIEGSFDNGTTYYQKAVKQIGTSYIANNFKSNFAGTVNVATLTHLAVRSTDVWTGTATVTVRESANNNGIYVHNGLNIQDSVIATNKLTVKSASTAPVATDPAVVVAMSPNSINNTLNAELGDFTGTITNATQTTPVVATGLAGYDNVFISINGTYTGATAIFQGSDDGGTTWYNTTVAARIDSPVIEGGFTSLSSVSRGWNLNIQGFDSVRVNPSAVATGTVNVRISAESAPTNAGATVQVASLGDGTNSANVVAGDTGFNGLATNQTSKTIPFTTSASGAQILLANTDVRGYSTITIFFTSVGSGAGISGQFSGASGASYSNMNNSVWFSPSSLGNGLNISANNISTTGAVAPFFQLSVSTLVSGTLSGSVILSSRPPFAMPVNQFGTFSVGSNSATGSAVPANAFYQGLSDGTNLVGARTAGAATNTTGAGLLGAGMMDFDGTNFQLARTATSASNTTGTGLLGIGNLAYDGTNYQRQYVNNTVALIAAGTTSTQSNKTFLTYNANKLAVLLNVVTATAATLTVAISGVSSAGYTYPILSSTAIATTGLTPLRIFPGGTPTANSVANDMVPSTVSITVTITGTVSYGLDYILGV